MSEIPAPYRPLDCPVQDACTLCTHNYGQRTNCAPASLFCHGSVPDVLSASSDVLCFLQQSIATQKSYDPRALKGMAYILADLVDALGYCHKNI